MKIKKKVFVYVTLVLLISLWSYFLFKDFWTIDYRTNITILKWIYKDEWLSFFQSDDKNISIIDVDLDKYWISFWWLEEDWIFYKKYLAVDYLKSLSNENVFAVVNWQFFLDVESERTGLSFPVKSDWKIFTDYLDNEITKRTLIVNSNNEAFIKEWYLEKDLLDEDDREVIVAFNPDVNARWKDKIWRSYIWLKWTKNVIFFIAKNLTQEDMNQIIKDYWVEKEDVIMLDWWPSAQFATKLEDVNYYWGWWVPQFNLIYKRK